jgi:hypothetical protein
VTDARRRPPSCRAWSPWLDIARWWVAGTSPMPRSGIANASRRGEGRPGLRSPDVVSPRFAARDRPRSSSDKGPVRLTVSASVDTTRTNPAWSAARMTLHRSPALAITLVCPGTVQPG